MKYGIVYVPYIGTGTDPWCKSSGRIEKDSLNDIYRVKEREWVSPCYEVREIEEGDKQ